jgi:hypothetical protein
MEIILPRGPVITVDSIQYIDGTGTPQTLDPTLYFVDNMSEPCRILPAYGRGWPATQWVPNAVTIKFTAGYEQTVTDTLTVPHVAPFTVPVSRASKALSLTSVTDVVASTLVAGCTMTNGIVTFPSGAADKVVSVVYQVSSIPESFLHAIKLILSTYYESRQEVVQGGGNFNTLPLPLSASSLLGTYELFSVGYPHE